MSMTRRNIHVQLFQIIFHIPLSDFRHKKILLPASKKTGFIINWFCSIYPGMKNKNEKSFDFWNDHSETFLEMALKRDYQEKVSRSDGFGKKQRTCGDTVEFYLMVKDNRVTAISYDIQGCLFSHACANALIHLALDKSIDTVKQITETDIINFLKTLPREEFHCAEHIISTIRLAIADYESASR